MDNTLIVNVVADTYPADISQTLPKKTNQKVGPLRRTFSGNHYL